MRPDEADVNRVVVARAGPAAAPSAAKDRVSEWLLARRTPDDPLELLDLLAKLELSPPPPPDDGEDDPGAID